jgi:hypothetical protein
MRRDPRQEQTQNASSWISSSFDPGSNCTVPMEHDAGMLNLSKISIDADTVKVLWHRPQNWHNREESSILSFSFARPFNFEGRRLGPHH